MVQSERKQGRPTQNAVSIQNCDAGVRDGWIVLLKFGQREYLEALRREGLVYMSTQRYFAELENDAVRTDPFEGTDQIHQPSAIKQITIKGPVDELRAVSDIVLTPADLAGPLSVSLSTSHGYNVYCLYGVRRPLPPPAVDERNFGFGDSFVVILNTQAFIDRLAAAARDAGFASEWRGVEYYDPNSHSGDTGVFRKPSNLAFQNEFRFATWPGLTEPLILRLGDLTDIISPVESLREINRLVEFRVEGG